MPGIARHILRPVTTLARHFAGDVGELFPSIVDNQVREATDNGWQPDDVSAYCGRCGSSVGPGEATQRGCSHCIRESIPWDAIVRLGAYKDPLESWVLSMKFHRTWQWAVWFGRQLAQRITINEHAQNVVCHVPMPRLRRWRRGYNQARLIARSLGKVKGLPVARLIRRRGWQHPQTTLPASLRAANVRNVFVMEPVDLKDCHVLLVDDVKTTGATLGACARLLKKAGASSVNCAVAAVADPKGADFKAT